MIRFLNFILYVKVYLVVKCLFPVYTPSLSVGHKLLVLDCFFGVGALHNLVDLLWLPCFSLRTWSLISWLRSCLCGVFLVSNLHLFYLQAKMTKPDTTSY